MPTVEFEGNTFNVDEDGFIDDFNNWNEAWVRHVKTTEGIEELTDEHWKVIQVLQDCLYTKMRYRNLDVEWSSSLKPSMAVSQPNER